MVKTPNQIADEVLKRAADEVIGGPYLNYEGGRKSKAIGMPPEEQASPEFSRPEPPVYGGYTSNNVSLPRYQFEVSEQPTPMVAKPLPSPKESVAHVLDKIAQAVEQMNEGTYLPTQYVVLQPEAQQPTIPPVIPPLVGGVVGMPVGWELGERYGLSKLPGYRRIDDAFNALVKQRGLLKDAPQLVRDVADVGGGTLWGKKELLKMFGPIGMYRLGGAALGLGGGMLLGSLANKALRDF
jgi:hypothetical protein